MDDQVVNEFVKIRDAFAEMRKEMRNGHKYFGKGAATDKFYEAMRQFAYEIGLAPPLIPLDADENC